MIELQNLTFSYSTPTGVIPVLRDITLVLNEWESVALIGTNGSGKTTLLRCLNGLLLPTKGMVRIDGFSVRDSDKQFEIRRRVGMVFQNPDDQIVSAQVEREIAFGLENLGLPTSKIRNRVSETLARFDLSRYRFHPPHLLSGGERQRLILAAVVAMRPRYLLLDEPTALLDPSNRQDLLNILNELSKSKEITPILVTQFPQEAVDADRIIVLHNGQVVLTGSPSEVFSNRDVLNKTGLIPPPAAQIATKIGLSPPAPLSPESLVDRLPSPPQHQDSKHSPTQTPPTGSQIVIARKLQHIYNCGLPSETVALQHLDLDLFRNSVVSLIGPNGSGKSTFVQHLNGLLKPTSGDLTVCDINLLSSPNTRDLRQRVGLIFQSPETQLFADTVFDDVAFGPRSLGLSDPDTRVTRALDEVGLSPDIFRARSPFTLSGGEKRRVAIAGVIAMRPELLILDEPTAGLDPRGVAEISGLLRRLNENGCTLLLISHDMDLVANLSNRVIAFDAGRLSFDLPPEKAFACQQRLLDLNLDLPEFSKIACCLRTRGWSIPSNALTLREISENLINLLEK